MGASDSFSQPEPRVRLAPWSRSDPWTETELRDLSDEVLADARVLETEEPLRRRLPPDSPEFTEISADERHVAGDLNREAAMAADLAERLDSE